LVVQLCNINRQRWQARAIRICAIAWLLACSAVFASAAPPNGGTIARSELTKCQNAQEHLVIVNGVRVHYLEAGAGQTIVLIHGNAGNVDDFSYRAVGLLCGDYKVVAIDRPGHGRSDRLHKESGRLESQAALLRDTLSSLGIARPILIGHSWGASLALAYALRYPNEISSMVLLAPAAYAENEQSGAWMNSLIKPPVIGDVNLAVGRLLFGKRMLKKELHNAFYPQAVPDDYLKSANASWLSQKHLRAYLEDERTLNASLKALSHRYSEIHVPVVIVTGDTDRVVGPQANAYRLKAAISQSQLVELKHAGHEIPQTDPESIRGALKLLPATSNARGR
jgi:pimeloyl-ACP methyl ester carboxylesterase